MGKANKDKGLEITEAGIFIQGEEIPGVTGVEIIATPGSQEVEVNLQLFVKTVEVSKKTLVAINKVDIPLTMTNIFERAIVEQLVDNDMIDPERV